MKIIHLLVAVALFRWLLSTNAEIPSLIQENSEDSSSDEDSESDYSYSSSSDHPKLRNEQVVDEHERTTSNATTILFIHYHKTGNNFVMDLLKEIHRTYSQHGLSMKEPSVLKRMNNKNGKNHLRRGQEKHDQQMIGRGGDDMDDDAIAEDDSSVQSAIHKKAHEEILNNNTRRNNTMMVLPQRRSHDPTTGCPILGDGEFEIGAAYRLSAPNFLCNLSNPVVVISSRGAAPRKLPFPAWETTKILHFVRDPIDMALSNYLYHSQYPTPEPWIKRRDIDPCKTDDQFLKLALDELNRAKHFPSHLPMSKITKDDLLRVSAMCRYYKVGHPIAKSNPNKNNKTRSFYGIMRRLPPHDGLRFATSHFLMAQSVQSGGDLLRMANNILRLQEWDSATGSSPTRTRTKRSTRQRSHVMTVSMERIVTDMRGSILEMSDFMFGHSSISNLTLRVEIAESIAEAMVARYQAKTRAASSQYKILRTTHRSTKSQASTPDPDGKNWTLRQKSHVTQAIMNDTERQLLKEQLEEDPILGHILLQLREIVNSVHNTW